MNTEIARKRLDAVLKKDSITSSTGDFMATHMPMKKLRVLNHFEMTPDSNGRLYTDEEVYEKFILNKNNNHQFVAVYGQSGSGKSHMIRWFNAKFKNDKPDNEVVIFIRRSDNTLKGTIKQLLSKPELQEIAEKENYRKLTAASESISDPKLKSLILSNFIVELEHDRSEQISDRKRKRVVAFLKNEYIQEQMLNIGGPIERIFSKVAETDIVDCDTIAEFKPCDFNISPDLVDKLEKSGADIKAKRFAKELMPEVEGKNLRNEISEYLNGFVDAVIQRCAGIHPNDFEELFMNVRKELYKMDKNLTFFIEDVTSFTGVDGALLNALMEDHNGRTEGNEICRISSIVGGTNGYIDGKFRDNHKDRVNTYIYIPDDPFSRIDRYEFVGRYLNVMSLTEEEIDDWIDKNAEEYNYPIHDVKEGQEWEYIDIGKSRKLCLYPFTKISIDNLYENQLHKGNKTPRFIISKVINPVIQEILNNKDVFPTKNISQWPISQEISRRIPSKINDKNEIDRTIRFMSVWGNGKAETTEIDGEIYIAGIKKEVYEDLNIPVVDFDKVEYSPEPMTEEQADVNDEIGLETEKQNHYDETKLAAIHEELNAWVNGNEIDFATTKGAMGDISKIRKEIGDFLLDSINWQEYGVSHDNVKKVENGLTLKFNFIKLENQKKGEGYYELPANWKSVYLMMAFANWTIKGKRTWNYDGSAMDAYIISAWKINVTDELVDLITKYDGKLECEYIDAAIINEIYRLILRGEYTGQTLSGIKWKKMFTDNEHIPLRDNCHSKDWMNLLEKVDKKNKASQNRKTVQQYFNIVQGGVDSSIMSLRLEELKKRMKSVIKARLHIPTEEIPKNDPIRNRRVPYEIMSMIESDIARVAESEIKEAQKTTNVIEENFDCADVDFTDEEEIQELIRDFIIKCDLFYSELNNTRINVTSRDFNMTEKEIKKAAKSLVRIYKAYDEKEALDILLGFSSDPVSDIRKLCKNIKTMSSDIDKVDRQLKKEEKMINDYDSISNLTRYEEEYGKIDNIRSALRNLR